MTALSLVSAQPAAFPRRSRESSNRPHKQGGYGNEMPNLPDSVGAMNSTTYSHSRRLSEREAADRLGVSPRTLQYWRHRSYGPAYLKLGRRVAYHPGDLDAFEASCRIQPKGGVE
jgi:hypothetical protein